VAYALPAEQFGSWVLFYRSVLGFVPDDLWELPDPHGIVRSRVVAAQGRSVCFALNISESRNTATGRSVSRFDGAGVHHIALATNNIFETAAKLLERGVSLLHIPQNYYLDLETRFDLTPDELENLRVGKILYDRSGSGEFFHLYTDFIEDPSTLKSWNAGAIAAALVPSMRPCALPPKARPTGDHRSRLMNRTNTQKSIAQWHQSASD
jgi:4-hydroxyphenylpyruvate dioxygenase